MTETEAPPTPTPAPASTCRRGFPFPQSPDEQAPPEFSELPTCPGLPAVQLSTGVEALLVTRYDEVRAVLSDDRFRREPAGRPLFARTRESLALAASDPPDHTRRRKAVAPYFTARDAERQVPRIRQIAAKTADELATRPEPADLVNAFAVPFALRVIAERLGVPEADHAFLRPKVDAMMSTTRFPPEQVRAAHEQAREYFADLIACREAELDDGFPSDDLLTDLLRAPDGRGLSRNELVVMAAGLLMAGYETTSNQMAMCVLMLLREPGEADRLRADPDLIPPAVETMLRHSALMSTGGAPHMAIEDVYVGDTRVQAGQVVVPLVDAANRDPQAGERPHLSFGHGRHFCLGAHLARVELAIGIRTLLERFPALELAVDQAAVTWREGMFIRGPMALPVRWT
jgi:cytochrome P450